MLRLGAISLEQLNGVLEPLGHPIPDPDAPDDAGETTGETTGRDDRRGRLRVREYLLVFLVAASVTYLLTVIAREIALRSGAVAKVRDRDVHDEPVPYLGGLAMLGGPRGGLPRGAASCPSSPAARRSSSTTPGSC